MRHAKEYDMHPNHNRQHSYNWDNRASRPNAPNLAIVHFFVSIPTIYVLHHTPKPNLLLMKNQDLLVPDQTLRPKQL